MSLLSDVIICEGKFVKEMLDGKMNLVQRNHEVNVTKLKQTFEFCKMQGPEKKQIEQSLTNIGKHKKTVSIFAVLVCLRNKEINTKTKNGEALRVQLSSGLGELDKSGGKQMFKIIVGRADAILKQHAGK